MMLALLFYFLIVAHMASCQTLTKAYCDVRRSVVQVSTSGCLFCPFFQYFHLQILISIGTWWSLLNIDFYLQPMIGMFQ